MLKPLPQSRLDVLDEILSARIVESNLSERTTLEILKKKLSEGYETRTKAAYVDDIDNPKHVIVVGTYGSNIFDESTMVIHLIYSKPEFRGDREKVKEMLDTAQTLARLQGVETLCVSSWIYNGSEPSDELWLHEGFVPQERVFIKSLKEQDHG